VLVLHGLVGLVDAVNVLNKLVHLAHQLVGLGHQKLVRLVEELTRATSR